MHRLAAAFMGYRPEDQPAVRTSEQDDEPAWRPPGAGIPATAELAAATSVEEALAAAERMFFGEVKK